MIIDRPARLLRIRRAFARMSTMFTLPASTMCSGASCNTSPAWTTRVQSSGPTRLLRMRSQGTCASAQSRRMPISVRDISSENTATGSPATATLRAMFIASEDFPTPGRAAITTRLPSCSPDVSVSRSVKPVGKPGVGRLAVLDALEVDHRLVHQVADDRRLLAVLATGDVVDALLGAVGDRVGVVGRDVGACR